MSKYFVGFKFITKHGPAEIIEMNSENFSVKFFETGNIEDFINSRCTFSSLVNLKDSKGRIYKDWRTRFQKFMSEDLVYQEERKQILEYEKTIGILKKGGAPIDEINRRKLIVKERIKLLQTKEKRPWLRNL